MSMEPDAPEQVAASQARRRVIRQIVGSLVIGGAAYASVSMVVKPVLQPEVVTAASQSTRRSNLDRSEIITFQDIIVNPAGTMGSRYLSTTVGLQVSTERARESLTEAQPLIKDMLITYLSSLTIEELTDVDRGEHIRASIRSLVNKAVAPQEVEAVLVLDFVLQ
jgi:flagellar basal body-associated protein FliL